MPHVSPYRPKHHVRIVTATSLFDGHDAAINVMRRLIQACGVEVIHLGHNRSVAEIVEAAIQEDAQGVAVTSYQGGHVEFFKYMIDRLRERGAGHVKVFGGGGGTILPEEMATLHAYGVTRLYSPDDGRTMGLQGMIDDLVERCDFPTMQGTPDAEIEALPKRSPRDVARAITAFENEPDRSGPWLEKVRALASGRTSPVVGITGTGGSGKSSLIDEIVRRFLQDFPGKTVAIVSLDPSKRKTGGALLGDRIRMNAIHDPRVYVRSVATRQANLALSKHVGEAVLVCKAAGFDLVLLETSGIGQSDTEVVDHCDVAVYVMTGEYGAATQLEKVDMLDFADVVAINKFDKRGSEDALRDVRKQYRRNHKLPAGGSDKTQVAADDDLPVIGTIASEFADPGTDRLYRRLMSVLAEKTGAPLRGSLGPAKAARKKAWIIPPERTRYLAEIAQACETYDAFTRTQAAIARKLCALDTTIALVQGEAPALRHVFTELERTLDPDCRRALREWPATRARYRADKYEYEVRGKPVAQELTTETLGHLRIPKVALPAYEDWGDILAWLLRENVPGEFPYAAGVFPLKRGGEDPTRMFAGEGGPERTNRRFHYVSRDVAAKRLSTAFDSVTLYGEDPHRRPDIYGKVGNSGVSVCTVDDAKKLYSGFDLCSPMTSVSMTINGPAPMVLAFFLNAAIDQQCEKWIASQGQQAEVSAKIDALYAKKGAPRPRYAAELPAGNDGLGLGLLGVSGEDVLPKETYDKIRADAVCRVRGTVQADILKEDQAQNTCIFSTEFALRMMGDVEQWFVDHNVRNFYSVSISGYHIAEAGAHPITQLAFTLANGFTYVEYYLSRGMKIDDFAPNLSFFFSNGMDAEYTVLGRVARRIWAKALKHKYGANERSQKLKYHIQTSGRSLHAQEIGFNDIRTTLQALCAVYDNTSSLHTNAYDEAITTPTEESVRRALAIQLILNKEWGLAKNENPLQGSFIVEELTDLVEAAVLAELKALDERGGVLGAMERMYQRSKIQDESLAYENKKHDGSLPIVGVNTFLDAKGSPTARPPEVIRSTSDEKELAIAAREAFQRRNADVSRGALESLQRAAAQHENTFDAMMDVARKATLGEMSAALYAVGGQYRRNM